MLPHFYVDAEVTFPFSLITAYTDIHYLSVDGNSLTDAILGLCYDLNLIVADIGVKADYRAQKIDVEDFDLLSFDIETKSFLSGCKLIFNLFI